MYQEFPLFHQQCWEGQKERNGLVMLEQKNLGVVQNRSNWPKIEVIGKEIISGSIIQQFWRPESSVIPTWGCQQNSQTRRGTLDTPPNTVCRFELIIYDVKVMITWITFRVIHVAYSWLSSLLKVYSCYLP